MRTGPLVTVAIPTLVHGPLLNACLTALNSQIFRDFEVIIVLNAAETLLNLPDGVVFSCRVIVAGSNLGFGAAVNQAIRASAAPFVAVLNDDTEPSPQWLQALVHELQNEPGVGMCASRIQLRNTSDIDSAGMLICFDGSSRQRGHFQPAAAFTLGEEVLFPSGCAALYRRTMLDAVGVFDEDYFLYCEDTDLGLRARWNGWTCRYAPDAVVAHHYSSTAGAFSPLKAGFVERNRLWVAIKNFPARVLIMLPLVTAARYFWQLRAARDSQGAAGEFVRAGNSLFSVAGILLRAHWETLLCLPALLRKRRQIMRGRTIGAAEFTTVLNRHRISAKELARA